MKHEDAFYLDIEGKFAQCFASCYTLLRGTAIMAKKLRRDLVDIKCQHCDKVVRGRKGAKYCSHSCVAAATRPVVSHELWSSVVDRYTKGELCWQIAADIGCSEETIRRILVKSGMNRRPRSTQFIVGTLRPTKRGYILIKVNNGERTNWRFEHLVKMENRTGRKLRPEEHTHHGNHVKSDNQDSNLGRITRSDHARYHNGREEVYFDVRRAYVEEPETTVYAIAKRFGISIATLYVYIEGIPRRSGKASIRSYARVWQQEGRTPNEWMTLWRKRKWSSIEQPQSDSS